MLRASAITVTYDKSTILNNVSLEFANPTVITGPSGSGKSTLLRVLAGQQKPDSGSVRLDDEPIQTPSWLGSADPRVALIHQDYRLVDFLTVSQNLELALDLRELQVSDEKIADALADVGLSDDYHHRFPETLSGGEQQRVAIARALLTESRLILADEPTGALDAKNTDAVTELLLDVVSRHGIILIVASHDAQVVERFNHGFHLSDGCLNEVADEAITASATS